MTDFISSRVQQPPTVFTSVVQSSTHSTDNSSAGKAVTYPTTSSSLDQPPKVSAKRPVLTPSTSFNENTPPTTVDGSANDAASSNSKAQPQQQAKSPSSEIMAAAAPQQQQQSAGGAQGGGGAGGSQIDSAAGAGGMMNMQDPIWTEALFSDPQQQQQYQQQLQAGGGGGGQMSMIDPALSGGDFGGVGTQQAQMWRSSEGSVGGGLAANGAGAPPLASDSPAGQSLGDDFAQQQHGTGRVDLARMIPKLGIAGTGSEGAATTNGSATPVATTPEAMIAAAQRLAQQQSGGMTGPAQPSHGPSPLGRYYLAANDPQHVSRHPLPPPHANSPGRAVVPNAIRHNDQNEPSPTLSVASDETFTGVPSHGGRNAGAAQGSAAAQQGGRSALFPAAPGSSSNNGHQNPYQTAMAPPHVPFPAPNGPFNPETSARSNYNTGATSASAGRPQLRQNTADSFASGMSTSSEEEDITSPMVLPETSLRRGEHGTASPGTPTLNQFSASPGKMSGVNLFPKLPNAGSANKGRQGYQYGQAQYTFTPKGLAPTFPPMSSSSSESETPDDESENPVDADYGTTSSGRPAGSVTVGRGGYDGYHADTGSRKPGGILGGSGGGGGSNNHSDDEDDEDKKRGRPRGFAGEATPKKAKKPRSKSPLTAGGDEEESEEEEYVENGVTKKRKISKEDKKSKKVKKETPSEDGDVICDYRDPLPPHTPCLSRFHRTYDLARHRETIHARNEGRAVAAHKLPEHLATVWLEYGKPQCAWPCEYPGCDQVFSRKDAMQRHMKTRKHDVPPTAAEAA